MHFRGKGGEIDVLPSYTPNDPFYELVTAVQAVYEFGNSHDVIINEEPNEAILNIAKLGDKLVLTLDRGEKETPSRVEASFVTGCREIARNIHLLYKEIGYDGFVKEWGHRPPKERIK